MQITLIAAMSPLAYTGSDDFGMRPLSNHAPDRTSLKMRIVCTNLFPLRVSSHTAFRPARFFRNFGPFEAFTVRRFKKRIFRPDLSWRLS